MPAIAEVRLVSAESLYEEGTFVEGLIASAASGIDANAAGGYVGRIRQGTANFILTTERFVGAVDRDASLTSLVSEGNFDGLSRNEMFTAKIGPNGSVINSGQASNSQADNIDVVWVDDALLASEGTPTGIPNSGGFTSFTAMQIAEDGIPIFRASYGSDGEAIFAGLGNTLIRTGDTLGIPGNAVTDLTNSDAATDGQSFGSIVTDTFGGSGDRALVVNNAIVARESDVIGLANGGSSAAETFDSFANVRVNPAGDVLYSATSSDDDWIAVFNGQVIHREGAEQDGLELIATSNIGLGLNADGDHAVTYQNGLFLNGELLSGIDLGVPITDLTAPGIETFQGSLDISDRYTVEDQTFVDLFFFARKESFTSNDSAILRVTAEIILDTLPGLVGDYNDSGIVEQNDLNLVLTNWGQVAPFEPNGDPFATPIVDQEELNRVLTNWGNSNTPPNLAGLPVPEPAAGLALLALAGLARVGRRATKPLGQTA
ncbi:MAG: hypothetical protein AAGF84_09295 [Planctomycetota bacterium]